MSNLKIANLLLRVGLAFSFFYAGISSFINPNDWVGYLPSFISGHRLDLLKVFSIYEIGLALWLLVGRYTRYAAVLATLSLMGVVVSNLHDLLVTFRDIGLIFAAIALVFTDQGSSKNLTR